MKFWGNITIKIYCLKFEKLSEKKESKFEISKLKNTQVWAQTYIMFDLVEGYKIKQLIFYRLAFKIDDPFNLIFG